MTDIAGIVLDAEGWRLTDVRLEPEDRVVARYEAADGAGWINVVLMPKDAPRRKLGRLGHCSVYYEGELAERSFEHRARAADLVANVHWVYKAHIVLGMTLFLITPFTRLVHIWSIPLGYLWRPYQVVRRRQPPLRYGPRS